MPGCAHRKSAIAGAMLLSYKVHTRRRIQVHEVDFAAGRASTARWQSPSGPLARMGGLSALNCKSASCREAAKPRITPGMMRFDQEIRTPRRSLPSTQVDVAATGPKARFHPPAGPPARGVPAFIRQTTSCQGACFIRPLALRGETQPLTRHAASEQYSHMRSYINRPSAAHAPAPAAPPPAAPPWRHAARDGKARHVRPPHPAAAQRPASPPAPHPPPAP